MKDHLETLGDLMCDRCGQVSHMQIESQAKADSPEELQTLVQEMFYASKRYFAAQGWFTSIGYDMCPDCCKVTGTTPGYEESGLVPDISIQPRARAGEGNE